MKFAATKANETFIYALVDPRSDEIRYIGKSNAPSVRLHSHLKDRTKNTRKSRWLNELVTAGLLPVVRILETCLLENWESREQYWINIFSSNSALLNSNRGGSGSFFQPERTRLAISLALRSSEKKRRLNEQQRGVKFSKERCSAIRAALRKSEKQRAKLGRPLSKEWRMAISRSRTSDSARKQLSELHRKKKGVPRSVETRIKISTSLKNSERAKLAALKDVERKRGLPQTPIQKQALLEYFSRKRACKELGLSEYEARKAASLRPVCF